MEGLWKKIIRCSFSPSLLEDRALSQVNIGIKYDIVLHAFRRTPNSTTFLEIFDTMYILIHHYQP